MESSGGAPPAEERRLLAASLTARYSDWVLEELDELPGSFLLTDPAMPRCSVPTAARVRGVPGGGQGGGGAALREPRRGGVC